MKVLIIGSGGREHALVWACVHSQLKPQVYCLPGNGGTAGIARNINLNPEELDEVTALARQEQFDLTIIGPESPLAAGLADKLLSAGLKVFGPTAKGALLESSKAYAKKVMQELNIPTPAFATFTDIKSALDYIKGSAMPVVVKASGLTAGKGAWICRQMEEALVAADAMLVKDAFGVAGREIVVEECLSGRELSLLAIVDGDTYLLLPPARDYKRALDNDQGSNTGGMGAYAPVPDVDDKMLNQIGQTVFEPVVNYIRKQKIFFRGCLYAGMMLTAGGPKVLEFNVRWGDPEAQAILPLLTDPLELMMVCVEGRLRKWMFARGIDSAEWRKLARARSAVSVVAVSEGYPGTYRKGLKIDQIPPETNVLIPFHAGTKAEAGQLFTTGGRVLAITGIGTKLEEAAQTAYKGVESVRFEGAFYRKDIGKV